MTIVVDASVAVKWVIPEVLSDQAGSLRGRASDEALAAYGRPLEPKQLVLLSGGHFDAYVKGFDTASGPARLVRAAPG